MPKWYCAKADEAPNPEISLPQRSVVRIGWRNEFRAPSRIGPARIPNSNLAAVRRTEAESILGCGALKARPCQSGPPRLLSAIVVHQIMKKRLLYGLLLTALALNLLLGARVYSTYAQAGEKDDVYQNIELFTRVLERVRKDYVDGDKVTYKELIYAALKGMLNSLDPHSEFMDADKYNELKNDTEGLFGGVGLSISVRDNFLTVVSPMADTPAFKAGILTGDRIIKIDGKNTEKFSLPEAVKRLRGMPGTDVSLTVLRPSSGQVRDD